MRRELSFNMDVPAEDRFLNSFGPVVQPCPAGGGRPSPHSYRNLIFKCIDFCVHFSLLLYVEDSPSLIIKSTCLLFPLKLHITQAVAP